MIFVVKKLPIKINGLKMTMSKTPFGFSEVQKRLEFLKFLVLEKQLLKIMAYKLRWKMRIDLSLI